MHYLLFETTLDCLHQILFFISGLWMLAKGDLPRAITAL